MKKTLLAIFTISLGIAAFAAQVRNETSAIAHVMLTDGPEPDCLPNCGGDSAGK